VSALDLKDNGLSSDVRLHKPLVGIIGSSYASSGDWHQTPLGKMPGALVLANATDSMQTVGLVQSPNLWIKLGVVVLILLAVSAMFAALHYFWAASLLMIAIAVTMFPLSILIVREQGIWLDVAIPMLGIYAHMQVERMHEAMHQA